VFRLGKPSSKEGSLAFFRGQPEVVIVFELEGVNQ